MTTILYYIACFYGAMAVIAVLGWLIRLANFNE